MKHVATYSYCTALRLRSIYPSGLNSEKTLLLDPGQSLDILTSCDKFDQSRLAFLEQSQNVVI